jgi:hypothetical protein
MIWALRQDWHCGTEHATTPRITCRDHGMRQVATDQPRGLLPFNVAAKEAAVAMEQLRRE